MNRRLKLLKDQPDRENMLVLLRRERGLSSSGGYSIGLECVQPAGDAVRTDAWNQQALDHRRLCRPSAASCSACVTRGNLTDALLIALVFGVALPYFVLRFLRSRRQKRFAAQFPDALDMIVRSLRAGHPTPIALTMVAREMKDPVGSEFGIVVDEITYGADLETALRNLNVRVGQDDLPLFVTAVAIQGSTGGNLGEILQNLSSVIRMRFKMRRKIRALAAEGRASALILSSLPIAIFMIMQIVAPNFYASVWDIPLTQQALMAAGAWMGIGNLIMYRLVNFKI